MDSALRAPPLRGLHRRHFTSTNPPLLINSDGKENRPPLESLLHPSPAPPFPHLRKSIKLRPPFSARELSINEQREGVQSAKEGKGKQREVQPVNKVSPDWLGNVRKQVWTTLRKEAEEERERSAESQQQSSHKIAGPPPPFQRSTSTRPSPPHPPSDLPRLPNPPPQHSTPLQPSSSSHHLALPSPGASSSPLPSFDTRDLPPVRHSLRSGGSVELLETGEVLLDLRRRGGVVYVVSGDGEEISLFQRSVKAPLILLRPEEVYDRTSLPQEHRRAYLLCAQFVEGVRGRVPRMSVYLPSSAADGDGIRSKRSRLTIFSDSPPSFECTFPSPSSSSSSTTKIRVDHPRHLIHLTTPSSPPSSLPLPLYSNSPKFRALPSRLRRLVRFTLDQTVLVERLVTALNAGLSSSPAQDWAKAIRETSLPLTPPPSPPLNASREMKDEGERTARKMLVDVIRRAVEGVAGGRSSAEKWGRGSAGPDGGEERSRKKGKGPAGSSEEQQQEEGREEKEEDRRHLPGVGWIIRRRLPSHTSSSSRSFPSHSPSHPQLTPQWTYQILLSDGSQLALEPQSHPEQVKFRGRWYAIDEHAPERLRRRLEVVRELLELFGD